MYKARTGMDMPKTKKRMTKQDLSNELRKVDRRPWNYGTKFRFQDLPPEMRNMVYREVLPTLPDEKFSTAILRVSKQFNSEARSILYGDRDGEVSIHPHVNCSLWDPLTRHTRVLSSAQSSAVCESARLADNRPEWPSYLLNFKRINLNIKFTVENTRHLDSMRSMSQVATNQELMGFVSFLSGSTALKSLRVTTTESASWQDDLWLEVLRPINRISPGINVDLFNVSEQVKDQILREKSSNVEMKHFFIDFQETHASLKELESFRVSVDSKDTLLNIEEQKATMDAALNVSGFIDDKAEKQLRGATAKTKAFLAGGVVDKVNRLARRKVKEMKQETAKKIEELEGLRQKFIGIEKAAKGTSANTTSANVASTSTSFNFGTFKKHASP